MKSTRLHFVKIFHPFPHTQEKNWKINFKKPTPRQTIHYDLK